VPPSLVYLADFSIDFSQCLTQPHGWCVTVGSTTTSLHCFAINLHWLRVPDRIKFRLAILVFRCCSNTAPAYLSRDLHWAADSDTRRRLRSSSSSKLVVPRTSLKTVGNRVFSTAAARIWNNLPPTITNTVYLSCRGFIAGPEKKLG